MLIYKRVKKVCGRNLGFSPLERMQMEFPVETATGTNVQVLAYINGACCLNCFFLILTRQFSVDGDILVL